jgi:hypothetical protein
MPEDAYLGNGNEGHDSDDYVPYYADSPDYDISDKDWYTTPSGDNCPWCEAAGMVARVTNWDMPDFEPEDEDDALMSLCRGHAAEYMGLSLDGLDHMESELYQDQQ